MKTKTLEPLACVAELRAYAQHKNDNRDPRFWEKGLAPLLIEEGLIPEPMEYEPDYTYEDEEAEYEPTHPADL